MGQNDEQQAAIAMLAEHYESCSKEKVDVATEEPESEAGSDEKPPEISDDMNFAEMMKVIDAREKWNKKRRNKVFEDVLQSLGGECHEDVVLPPSIMNLLPKETKEKKVKGKKGKKNRK